MEKVSDEVVAGRELDALIDARLFGHSHGKELGHVYRLSPAADPRLWGVPHYSTDLAAAWLVVEKVAARNADTIVSVTRNSRDGERMGGEDKYFCTIEDVSDGIEEWEASADTAPLAICLAALKAAAPAAT